MTIRGSGRGHGGAGGDQVPAVPGTLDVDAGHYPSRPTAIFFDLDDTLYPYAEYARAGLTAAADALAEATGVEVHEELHRLYFEDGITGDTFDRICYRYGLDPALVEDMVAAFHDSSGPLDAYEDTVPVLETLGEDATLGVITDGKNGFQKLYRLDLRDHFDTVVATPPLGITKHDRRAFEYALRDLSVAPTRTVYVGDDPRVDFRIPNALGMGTVRLTRGRYAHLDPLDAVGEPDREIDALSELPALLDV